MNQNITVSVHTSLPPSINKSEAFFYLNLHINYIKWLNKISSNYEDIIVKAVWWGEESNGAIFVPRCVNLAGYKQIVKTHAIYPVRVPLNHFTTYLSDMNQLQLDIIDKNKHSVIGRATIDQLDQLIYNRNLQSISGIFNETNSKVGEIAITMTLETAKSQKSCTKPIIVNGINEKTVTKPIITNEITEKASTKPKLTNEISVNRSQDSIKPKFIDEFQGNIEKSENVLDRLINASKKIRETITIDVKDDEINDEIMRRRFPDIDQAFDKKWINEIMVNPDSVNGGFSINEPSKIHTESILKMSGDFYSSKSAVRSNTINNNNYNENSDRDLIRLIAASDDLSSVSASASAGDYFLRQDGKYQSVNNSHEEENDRNLLRRFDKELSSDDDPCKRDSIIEELFYKQTQQPEPNGARNLDIDNFKNKSSTKEFVPDLNANNSNNKTANAFEIYQCLTRTDCEKKRNEKDLSDNNCNADNTEETHHGNVDMLHNGTVDRNWFNNISSIKVFLDMLWLNSTAQRSNARSRSQSSNCSSDRDKCRRSCDSASSFNNSSNSFSVTKPPTPQMFQLNPSYKYFIDYKFPTNVTCNPGGENGNLSNSLSTTRVSVKQTGSSGNSFDAKGIKSHALDHVSEFPVSFTDGSVIQKWWQGLVRFKLISQDSNKKETVVGLGIIALRNIISTNNFYRLIPIRLPRNKSAKSKTRMVIGSLAVRTAMVLSMAIGYNSSEKRSSNPISHFQLNNTTNAESSNHSRLARPNDQLSFNVKTLKNANFPLSSVNHLSRSSVKIPPISVQSLLYVSNIRYVNPKSAVHGYISDTKSCNLYLIGRLLWSANEKFKSRILWGASKVSDNQSVDELENFKFVEKTALILTSDLMEKLKNNFSILEVWDISTDKSKQSLFGLVKIPVNIFHMSFKNDKIRKTILNNVYPLLSVDDWINIEDPISGKSKGQIHVLLAMGSPQQIEDLLLSKENTFNGHWNRNYLTSVFSNSELVEHSIEVDIESLGNFQVENYSESTLKENYFYVQYYFPLQNTISDNNGKNWESAVFRSVNCQVERNVDICDTNRHRFRLPIDSSLKTILNKHFESLGKKYILFELYLKQYQPFPSSKSIAKGRLPVTSLFQIINQHSVDVDSLAETVTQRQLPVKLVNADHEDTTDPVALLNIRVCYKTSVLQNSTRQKASNTSSPYDQPIIRIEIMSATGLQLAAESLVSTHPELQYPSVTGLNVHAKFWLTDESNKQSRIYVNSKGIQKFQFNSTKTIPRTFTPKFDSISEVLLGPIIDDENSNSLYKTLAEKILCGIYQLNVEVYHYVFESMYSDITEVSPSSKILIGKGRISIADLLLRSSGFMGPIWVPIFSPINSDAGLGGLKLNWPSKRNYESLYALEKRKSVGAVEIRLGFLDKSDRKNILQLAMDSGYVVPWTNRLETEDLVWQHMDIHGCTFKYITVNIEEIELSEKLVSAIFTPEVGFKKSSIKILTRYRMFKKSVSSSPNFLINEDEISDKIFIPVNHEQQYCYRVSSDLFRYLRESKLEIQVWGIYGSEALCNNEYLNDHNDNPNNVRLLGSALFDLNNLILPSDQLNKSINHILPIWKRGLNNCGNSNITVTISICGETSPLMGYNSDNEEESNLNASKLLNNHSIGNGNGNVQRLRPDHRSFPVHVIIEKAVNLKSTVLGNESNSAEISYRPLNYFVSFPCSTDNKYITSSIIKGLKEAVWNFECDTRLPYDLLTNEKLTLDFKVYCSMSDSDSTGEILDEKIIIGMVKLDLFLLLKGFERVIGWYNIVDMQGDCQGQIKVGITPTIPLVPNTAVLSKINNREYSLPTKPLTIEDHQSYLSSVRMRLLGQSQPVSDLSIPISIGNCPPQDTNSQDLVSKSFLFDTLKEKLRELDTMNETFKKKMEIKEVDNKIENSAQAKELDVPNIQLALPVSKVDDGTNTEDESYGLQNQHFNNNCHSDVQYDGDQFDSDGQDRDISSDDNERFNNYMSCINELEPIERCGDIDMRISRDSMHSISKDNEHLSARQSQSDSYSTSSCEVEQQPQSVCSSRYSSSCSQYDKSSQELDLKQLDEIISEHERSDISYEDPLEKPNDSWDEALPNKSNQNEDNNCSKNMPTNLIDRKPNMIGAIPKFFPQSFDFQEKMKVLQRNIENNLKTTNGKIENNSQSAKQIPLIDISDQEASRISKIFGIQKQ